MDGEVIPGTNNDEEAKIDYVEFWQTIFASKTKGHYDLRKLLETKKIRLGDSIPNIEFWIYIKSLENLVPPETMGTCMTLGNLNSDTSITMEATKMQNKHGKGNGGYQQLVNNGEELKDISQQSLLLEDGRFFHFGERINGIQNDTIFRIILDHVINGHELILEILDTLIGNTDDEKCSQCLVNTDQDKIKVDLCPMFKRYRSDRNKVARNKMRVVHDLIEIQNERGNDENIKKIFKHPVVKILILKKWEDRKIWYFHDVRWFTLFVFLFSVYVRVQILKSKDTSTYTWMTFFKNRDENWIMCGILMGVVIMSQILGACWYLVGTWCCYNEESAHIHNENSKKRTSEENRKKRTSVNMFVYILNAVYLIIANLVCLISALCGTIFLEVVLLVICFFLFGKECVQFSLLVLKPAAESCKSFTGFLKKVFRKRYWKDPENYLEIIFFISVPVAIFVPDWEQSTDETESLEMWWKQRAFCRGFVAMGVFAAWIEFVIKLGNVSHSGFGDFIKMFYNILKNKFFSYMQVCVLLITAFSISFWVILEGQTKDGDGASFSEGFWFSQVLTTTMSIGEFNTGSFYKSIQGNGFTKVFAMLFLIGMICLITITMINLLVAAIISDFNKMKDEVEEENLYFIAEYIIEIEKYSRKLEDCILSVCGRKRYKTAETWEQFKLKYCPHLICNECEMEPLPIPRPGSLRYNPAMEANERNPLLYQLLEIKKRSENLCEYHKEKGKI